MAMSNADNPMAETPKVPARANTPKVDPAPRLGRASESGDAGVHFLLAQRLTHAANANADGVKDVDDELAALGLAV
jgi:hypothetical protein